MMRIRRFGASLLALLLLCALPSVATAAPFSALVVFGDSLSDSGNVYAATGGAYPPPPYAQRFSNGPVAVEYLAASLGIPLVNYAYGGATTGTANYLNTSEPALGGALPGMAQQLQAYLASGAADPAGALYFVWGGANDVFNAEALGQDPIAALTVAAGNVASIVATLFGAGAAHVVVGGLPDLGLAPAFAANRAAGTALTDYYNGLLLGALGGGPAMFWDAAVVQRSVIANPAAFGLTNVTDACVTTNPPSLCGATQDQQNRYFFWDSAHPTTAVHRLSAASLAEVVEPVPEPATLLLLGSGLAGLVVRLRRAP